MVSVKDIKDTVVAEAAEVKARVDALEAKIAELVAANTDGATQAELMEIQEAVKGIFTPPTA